MTITKSPYISNPDILFCHEARSTRSVALDFGSADMLPAGTLISCEGKAVNDRTALGVLLYDTWKGYGSGRGVVLISGHVDLAKAQENSGQTYSSEAKAALKGICFVGDTEVPSGGGVSSWNDLTDKPFGELKLENTMGGTYIYDTENQGFALDFQLTAGNKYILTINGEQTELITANAGILQEEASMVYLGNASLMDTGENTGENFFICYIPSYGMGMGVLADTSITELVLTVEEYSVSKIDKIYIEPTKKVFYIDNLSNPYIYNDSSCENKTTLTELQEVVDNGETITIQYCEGGVLFVEIIPLSIVVRGQEYGKIVFYDDSYQTLYTAEYTS